jgi:putative restriction endonuclease
VGQQLWQEVHDRLLLRQAASIDFPQRIPIADEVSPTYGSLYLTRARLGQGAFRVLVTDAYRRRCAITGERTLPALQASHIKPVAQSGPNRVSNGLLLRADLHLLFDAGYLTIDEELRVEVSPRIKEDYENGRDYYRLQGQRLAVAPNVDIEKPSREFIEWHNERVYGA